MSKRASMFIGCPNVTNKTIVGTIDAQGDLLAFLLM
jgi:hypothetical protein